MYTIPVYTRNTTAETNVALHHGEHARLSVTMPYSDVFGGKATTGWSVVGANSLLCCCLKKVGYILLSLCVCGGEKEGKGRRGTRRDQTAVITCIKSA